MNNEPVAWISENDLMNICHKHPPVSRDKILDDDIPLYSEGFVRQQQAEIEALKADKEHLIENYENLMADFKIETYWKDKK